LSLGSLFIQKALDIALDQCRCTIIPSRTEVWAAYVHGSLYPRLEMMMRCPRLLLQTFRGSSKHLVYCRSLSSAPPEELINSLPWQYLRAADPSNFDPFTYQRVDVRFDTLSGIPLPSTSAVDDKHGPPISIRTTRLEGDTVKVQWSDGRLSSYPITWLKDQVKSFCRTTKNNRIYWKGLTEEQVRESSVLSMEYKYALSDEGMRQALHTIYRYGILLISGTPVSDRLGVAVLGAALGGGNVKTNPTTSLLARYRMGGTETILEHGTDGPFRTLYGTVWSTSSATQLDGTSQADSSYGSGGLPLHTDMTYMRDPPGLQIFTMVNPSSRGGESVFGDGFAVADKLKIISPTAFAVLSKTTRRFRCIDTATGWNLQAVGPVISVRNGNINGIRHNDLDRLPDLPPAGITSPEDVNAFYSSLESAHEEWDKLLMKDEFRLVMKLNPGDTIVVANQVSLSVGVSDVIEI
jgi:alpha-ketoglutarate-dependent taurine dioxygenase